MMMMTNITKKYLTHSTNLSKPHLLQFCHEAVHKVRHIIFYPILTLLPLSHFVTHPGTSP